MAKTTKQQPAKSQSSKPQTAKPKTTTPVNAPSKTGNESGKGRGNNFPKPKK